MRILAGALLGLAATGSCFANTLTTDYTDLWWNPNESGWGANVAQQTDTMVVVLYVYNGPGQPVWMIAPDTELQPDGSFKGTLYTTTGTFYRNPYHTSDLTTAAIGTLTFTPSSATQAKLVYTVGGDKITKDVQRQTWRNEDYSGYYIGARMGHWDGCGPPLDGKVSSAAQIGVTQNGTSFSARDQGDGYTCTYTGTVNQQGRIATIAGLGQCDDQVNRELIVSEVFSSREAFSMRYVLHLTGTTCNFTGYVGGIRRLDQ